MIALLIWLSSMQRWWAGAPTTYVSAFIMTGTMVGAYAGWAFDEVDDAREERRMFWVIGFMVVLPRPREAGCREPGAHDGVAVVHSSSRLQQTVKLLFLSEVEREDGV